MRNLLLVVVILLGITLISTALVWHYIPGWTAVPGGFLILFGLMWEKVLVAAQKVVELWRSWQEGAHSSSSSPSPSVQAGDHSSIHTGSGDIIDGGSTVHKGTGDIISGKALVHKGQGDIHVHSPAPLEPAGREPPLHVPHYVQRGVEERLMSWLQTEGAAAIVGVVGYGGVGKSTTAQYVRDRLEREGVFHESFWVYCGERDVETVLADYATQCGLDVRGLSRVQIVAELQGRLKSLCRERRVLVILDDVRDAHRSHLQDLLPPRPCAGLITSRLRHLPLPHSLTLDVMTDAQARELLIAHLGESVVSRDLRATERLLELTRRHPLALDVAARRIADRVRWESPIAWFVALLEKRGLDALDHYASVKQVLDLSYMLLDEELRRAFRFLGVFASSGFSVEDAAAVWEVDEHRARNWLRRLEYYSLLKPLDLPVERYRLHDLLHALAQEHLREAGEESQAYRRLVDYLLELFDRHYVIKLTSVPQLAYAFDNLERAATWAERQQDADTLARLATKARNWLHNVYHRWDTWQHWLERSLAWGISDPLLRANTLKALGDVWQFRKELDRAIEAYEEALGLYEAVGDRLGRANTLAAQGRLALVQGHREKADDLLAQAVALHTAIGSLYDVATDYYNYALVLRKVGDEAAARTYFLEAAQLYERIGLQKHARDARQQAEEIG